MPPPDPLTRLGLARSPAMKLLRPTQEQMNDISMPESFRNFVIEQQGVQGNQDAIQRAALQEQNALAAEQAAQEYFNQPATARERFLADNPQAYASSAGPGIYREQMMQTRQSSLADRTLAPTLSRKLPVTARGDFQRLVEEGTPVLEAYNRAEVIDYNRGQRAKLAEFYSPEEVKAKFGSDEAPIGDDAVQYAIRERKAGGGSTLGSLKAYADFATERLKRFAPEGFAPDPSDTVNYPKYEAALKDVEEAEAAYLNALRGAGGIRRPEAVQPATLPGGAVPKGAELQGLRAAPAAQVQLPEELDIETRLTRVPVTEQAAELERLRKEQAGKVGKEKQWEQAKTTLEEKLKEVFPDKPYEGTSIKPLEQLALQIIGGVQVADDDPNAPTDEFGVTPKIPIHEAALRRLKLGRFGKAFTEEGRGRLSLFGLAGTQDVTNNELIRDWAQKFAEKRGLLDKEPSAGNLTPEAREKVRAKVLEQIETD
jgi:hypothetical protein